jgi:outer membrane protein OmpA-like peptidoglycan-associated protein
MTPEEKATASTVYYGFGKDAVTSPMERDLNRLVELMKANPTAKLKIVGHADKAETEMATDKPEVFANISQRRINQMIQYLVEQGIPESRLVGQDSGDRKPADSSDTSDEELKQAKNRRVEFVFMK